MSEQFVAFIRGINVSGKNKVSMPQLKVELEDAGFRKVRTLLNSGNILLESDFSAQENGEKVKNLIAEKFSVKAPVYCVAADELKVLFDKAPDWWGTENKSVYHNLIFILTEEAPEEIASAVGEPSVGLEKIALGEKVIYWSFVRAKYQKCVWWKQTAAEGIAEKLTIRTAGTVKKLVDALKNE